MKPIGLASDHAGFELKSFVCRYLDERGIPYVDFGTHSSDSCDYPDFGHALGCAIDGEECERGIAVCGSGEGISMTLNKHAHVRAALCWMPEIAALSRQHNNAHLITIGPELVSIPQAMRIIKSFLAADYDGGRHQIRVDMLNALC